MNRVYKRKKRKSRLLSIKFIFLLIIIVFWVYLNSKYEINHKIVDTVQTLAKDEKIIPTKINVEEQEYSSKNLNVEEGQSIVSFKDGYTNIFTTLNKENEKTYKEFKQNLETASWSEKSYWGGTMRENGCGITTLAIIASGYGYDDVTPETLREKFYPHLSGDKIQEALEDMGIKCTDFYFSGEYLSKKYIMDWLKTNRPVIICVGNDKKNKWTSSSHYMTLLDINSDGYVYLSNPNGLDGEDKASRMV